jgi:hypothetical protein
MVSGEAMSCFISFNKDDVILSCPELYLCFMESMHLISSCVSVGAINIFQLCEKIAEFAICSWSVMVWLPILTEIVFLLLVRQINVLTTPKYFWYCTDIFRISLCSNYVLLFSLVWDVYDFFLCSTFCYKIYFILKVCVCIIQRHIVQVLPVNMFYAVGYVIHGCICQKSLSQYQWCIMFSLLVGPVHIKICEWSEISIPNIGLCVNGEAKLFGEVKQNVLAKFLDHCIYHFI